MPGLKTRTRTPKTKVSFKVAPPTENQKTVYPYFSRHETFHPRFGWLKKGYDGSKNDTDVFNKEDATVILGVGKNMVRAIRYWSNAFKVTREEGIERAKSKPTLPSDFGKRLLGDRGWDPYMENPSSLWLLHWNLLKPPCYAATWFFAFNLFNGGTFVLDDLLKALMSYKEREFPTVKAQEETLSRDVSCLIHMYVSHYEANRPDEDTLDSPFAQLDLIKTVGDSKHFAFNLGNKNNLAPEIIVAACLEFAASNQPNLRTISMSRLLFDAGSPGLIFKLTESALYEAVEKVCKKTASISLSDTAGVVQLAFKSDPAGLAETVLDRYYAGGHK
jgi:hypothetical protein